ncbi:MAG: solute:sodium symporter family transporter [Planctomycetes bacterium]|nr:solute:sodium symporter family transporter [Planctomycetota bacterium]
MHTLITFASFAFFTGLVALGTWLTVRRTVVATTTSHFLAGRSLGAVFIAGSLLLTNLSTEQLVGLNGAAYSDGLSVMAWEVVSVLSLVAMALFFLPRFLRSGISTVPQFLELRFDRGTQVICNLIFLIAYTAILLPIVLYTGATGLNEIVDVQGLTGIHDADAALWLTVWVVGMIGTIYAVFGGMRGIAVADTFNGVLLLSGGLMIVGFALAAVGKGEGILAGLHTVTHAHPEKFNSLGTASQSVPFPTLITGVILLTTFYWCTNQSIIQRTFAARNLAEGQKGVLLTGALKLLGPLYLVVPGIIAFHLYADSGLKPDHAYGKLVREVLPAPLTGYFLAAMMGAVLSSFGSALNSTATLFSMGIYKGLWSKDASEDRVVRAGKYFALVVALVAMTVAPMLAGQTSIFGYLQKMNGMYFIPIFSVVLMGLLLRRLPAAAAKTGLIGGFLVIATGYFVPLVPHVVKGVSVLVPFTDADVMNGFHFLGAVFVLMCAVMFVIMKIAPRAEPWVQAYSGDVEMTSWRGTKPAAALLVLVVLSIYMSFADVGAALAPPPPAAATPAAPEALVPAPAVVPAAPGAAETPAPTR